uniref:Gamma-glutamylcyclotransferase n=1 Tax=Ascaris lumbricoides TaxID=6252 RepID=A0A0M3IH68_ASCLU
MSNATSIFLGNWLISSDSTCPAIYPCRLAFAPPKADASHELIIGYVSPKCQHHQQVVLASLENSLRPPEGLYIWGRLHEMEGIDREVRELLLYISLQHQLYTAVKLPSYLLEQSLPVAA